MLAQDKKSSKQNLYQSYKTNEDSDDDKEENGL